MRIREMPRTRKGSDVRHHIATTNRVRQPVCRSITSTGTSERLHLGDVGAVAVRSITQERTKPQEMNPTKMLRSRIKQSDQHLKHAREPHLNCYLRRRQLAPRK